MGRMDYVGRFEDLKDVSAKDVTQVLNYAIEFDGKVNGDNIAAAPSGEKATITQQGNGDIKNAKNITVISVEKNSTTPSIQPSAK